MPLKIYRQKISKKATAYVNVDGKEKAIEFTGGLVIEGESTGCYVTSDIKIQKALESRKDFSLDKYSSKGNFYIETIISSDEENASVAENEKVINIIPPTVHKLPEGAEDYDDVLRGMIKEKIEGVDDVILPSFDLLNLNTTTEEITVDNIDNSATDAKAAEDLSHITNYQAAKSYLMKNCGATPDDVKNKESLLAYCEKNQINLPNFK